MDPAGDRAEEQDLQPPIYDLRVPCAAGHRTVTRHECYLGGTLAWCNETLCQHCPSGQGGHLRSIINGVNPQGFYVCHADLKEYFDDPRVTDLYHPS